MEKFYESQERWKEYRKENGNFTGLCLWQVQHDSFLLEAWNHKDHWVVIVQIWADGHGFTMYKQFDE